jgi:superoxide reductase
MNRRLFIQMATTGAAAGILLPGTAVAKSSKSVLDNSSMAGGLYFTKEAPGRWIKKAGSHSPIVTKSDAGIRVLTGHPMIEGKHWIIKHILLDADFKFISENIFDPAKDKAASSIFDLNSDQKGQFYALSVCNKHDTWVSSIEV